MVAVAGDALSIEGYDIGDVISRGVSSRVHTAHDLKRDVDVAVRVCSDLRVDVRRAAQAASYLHQRVSSVDHKNLLTVHGVMATGDGEVCVITDLTPGGSAAGFLRAGPVPVHVALDVGVRIADALATAHSAVPAVLHGRVAPDDILIADDGEPLLANLGVASLLPLQEHELSPHVAPETLHGLPPTARTDIYGLGSTLYTLLAGAPPFGDTNGDGDEGEFRRRVLQEDPPTLRRLDLPELGELAIYTALEKDPGDRFQSAAAMRDALAAARVAFEAGPESPGDVPPGDRDRRPGPRRSAAPALFALGLVVVLIVAVIVFSATGR